jgi:hypothetical protein
VETGLFSLNGQLRGEAAGKYRQVQHYIELLRPLPLWQREYSAERPLRILDGGCGKAYLSLALYQYALLRGIPVNMLGVDSNPDLVGAVAGIAVRLGFEHARFESTTIAELADTGEPVDLLVSLHACDTATDEALAAGVRLGAQAIVLAPCCHQELAGQIAANRKAQRSPAAAHAAATLGSGLLLHRQAEIVTDSLRAAALAALGYSVDVIEFVSHEDTARNLMIRASRRSDRGVEGATSEALTQYRALADEWGVVPALESLLGPLWPPMASLLPG